jgi:NAD(P)-dependent dehydrogenase (short-subunit alcohol dehydrogenase family)
MTGETCLVTGSTRGIGFYTARALAIQGAHVILVGHNEKRGAQALERILRIAGEGSAHFFLADLSAQDSILRLARDVQDRYAHLDVLVNNVGGFFWRRQESADGIEMTFALNHLSYFALTSLLLDMLKESSPARIVNVASDAHRRAEMRFDDLQFEQGYDGFRAYAQSKLANLLFTYELARRLGESGVIANALHPGFVNTHIYSRLGLFGPLIRLVGLLFAKSPKEGAQTSIYVASSPQVEGISGAYFVDQEPTSSSPASYDEEAARRLWEVSRDIVDLSA